MPGGNFGAMIQTGPGANQAPFFLPCWSCWLPGSSGENLASFFATGLARVISVMARSRNSLHYPNRVQVIFTSRAAIKGPLPDTYNAGKTK